MSATSARPRRWRAAVPVVSAAAGVLFVTSAASAGGLDLRSSTTDLQTLVQQRSRAVETLHSQEQQLRADVAALTATVSDRAVVAARRAASRLAPAAGVTAVSGPGLRVALNDAPAGEPVPAGLDPNLLVVHQQDLQAFVNALWAGGATAISIQGQRVVATTGIKCVGNTVVLRGVPYSPPYVIMAIGDVDAMRSALAGSAAVEAYRAYVRAYALGLRISAADELAVPGYDDLPLVTYASRR